MSLEKCDDSENRIKKITYFDNSTLDRDEINQIKQEMSRLTVKLYVIYTIKIISCVYRPELIIYLMQTYSIF